MESKEINVKIKQAFSNAVPDVLDSILYMKQEQKGEVIEVTEAKTTNPWSGWIAGIVAACLLLLSGALGLNYYHSNYTVAATVALEVNPSVEIKVNQHERILDVSPRNEDGRVLLGDMDFAGSDLDTAINAIIGSMLRNGYLTELANSILVTVEDADPVKGAALQERLTREINNILQTGAFSGAVLSQTIYAEKNLRTLAESYGITVGKAQLIREITEKNSAHLFEELVPLSINQLNLLRSSAGPGLEKVQSLGQASDKAYIGREAAKEIALGHAGAAAADVRALEVEMDWEHGVMVYEVEFKYGGFEYEYEIDAINGTIYKIEKERDDRDDFKPAHTGTGHSQPDTGSTRPQTPAPPAYIGGARAKEIALGHAGAAAADVRALEIEMDWEHGVLVYEVEFKYGGFEYEYEIDAVNGTIYKVEKERDQ